MTREDYIELVQTKLKRIDSTARFHPRYVEAILNVVWENFAFEAMGKMGTDPFFYSKQYTPVTVAVDSNGWYYSNLLFV